MPAARGPTADRHLSLLVVGTSLLTTDALNSVEGTFSGADQAQVTAASTAPVLSVAHSCEHTVYKIDTNNIVFTDSISSNLIPVAVIKKNILIKICPNPEIGHCNELHLQFSAPTWSPVPADPVTLFLQTPGLSTMHRHTQTKHPYT